MDTECFVRAAESLRREIAQLSIVGRQLLPDEQQRLNLLARALDAVESLMAGLAAPRTARAAADSAGISDGRYELGNDHLAVELRVDAARCGVVSADIAAHADGFREHVASFRSPPGVRVNTAAAQFQIVGEDADGQTAAGTLSWTLGPSGDVAVQFQFGSALRAIPANTPVSVNGRRAGDALRTLGIELECEQGCLRDPSFDFNGRIITIESALRDAGFDVFNVGRGSDIPTPSAGVWADGQLHTLMADFAQEPLGRRAWNLHTLMLSAHELAGLLGVMFDSGAGDVNRSPREGAAIFQTPIRNYTQWQRKLIQTTVHELGHAMNLAHRFERAVGRADSTSFMNYDWRYLGGNNENLFWQRFAFSFDDDELEFLRHGPRHKIVPGGAEFHTVPYWRNTGGGYSPYLPERPATDLVLRLQAPASGNLFQFAQPVLLSVELQNNTGAPLDLPAFLVDPKAGFLDFVIERSPDSPNGSTMTFAPVVRRCFSIGAPGADVVNHGGSISNNVNLTFGSAGFTFAEPGNYRVTAVLAIPVGRPRPRYELIYRSDPLLLRVAYPLTDDDERDALRLFRPDVGLYLALGGSAALNRAADTLEEVRARRQGKSAVVTDPLVAAIMRCQGFAAARQFVRYAAGKFASRDGDAKTSSQLLGAIAAIAGRILDPVSAARLASTSTGAAAAPSPVRKPRK